MSLQDSSERVTSPDAVNSANSNQTAQPSRPDTVEFPQTIAESQHQTALLTSEDSEKVERDSKSDRQSNWFKQYWWLALLGVLLVGGVAVWQPWSNTSEETPTETETVKLSVRTTKAKIAPIRAWVSSEGNVQAVSYKHLAFEVEGDVTYIADRNGRELREGDRVSEGELLATVDERELLADVSPRRKLRSPRRVKIRAAAAAEVARGRKLK